SSDEGEVITRKRIRFTGESVTVTVTDDPIASETVVNLGGGQGTPATFLPNRIERAMRSGRDLDVSAGNNQQAFFVSPDETRFWMIENGGSPPFLVEQWVMSTPGDPRTATLEGTFDHGLADNTTGIQFNSTGTRMYILD